MHNHVLTFPAIIVLFLLALFIGSLVVKNNANDQVLALKTEEISAVDYELITITLRTYPELKLMIDGFFKDDNKITKNEVDLLNDAERDIVKKRLFNK